MLGVLVNAAAVVAGSLFGLLAKKAVPDRFTDAVMKGIGLCIVIIGIQGALQGENTLVLIIAIVLGAVIGTALNLDGKIAALGEFAEKHLPQKNASGGKGSISQGFVAASLLFCVGSMTVVGSLNAGLSGDNTMLFTKSVLDLISAAMLTVSLGAGVILSAVVILVFQGSIVLLSGFLHPLISNPSMLAEMNCAGSLLIAALGLNILGVTKIKVADYMPAIIIAPLLTHLL